MTDGADLKDVLAKLTTVICQQHELLAKHFDEGKVSGLSASVTGTSNFQVFDEKRESFKQYRRRLENWFELRGISLKSKQSAQELIHNIGSSTFNILCALTAPDEPSTKSYEELVELLQDHLCPEPNVVIQQHRFLSRQQAEDENIARYVAELRQLAASCQFQCQCKKSIADVFLRAQFIRGIADAGIREKLLQSSEVKFEKLVENALAIEASKIDNKEFSKSHNVTAGLTCVNRIIDRHTTHSGSSQRSNSRARSQSRNSQSNACVQGQKAPKSKFKSNFQQKNRL